MYVNENATQSSNNISHDPIATAIENKRDKEQWEFNKYTKHLKFNNLNSDLYKPP